MEKGLCLVKLGLASVIGYVSSMLGGYDVYLSLLVSLVAVDILTGVIYAIFAKTLSSTEMKRGIASKLLIFVAVFITFKIDKCILESTGSYISILGTEVYIRTFFIIYSCLEEGISVLENLSKMGVPFPRWVKDVLVQVSDCANKSTPKFVLKLTKSFFNKYTDYTTNKSDTKEDVKHDEDNNTSNSIKTT